MIRIAEKYPNLYNECRKYPEIILTNNIEQTAVIYRLSDSTDKNKYSYKPKRKEALK